MHRRRDLSLFLSRTTLEHQDLWYLRMTDWSSRFCKWVLSSSYMDGGILRCLCLNGTSSFSTMWCLIWFVKPISLSLREKILGYCLIKFWSCSNCPGLVSELLKSKDESRPGDWLAEHETIICVLTGVFAPVYWEHQCNSQIILFQGITIGLEVWFVMIISISCTSP